MAGQRPRPHSQKTSPEVLQRIEELYPRKMDKEVAEILNAEGHNSGMGLPFTAQRVTHVRSKRGWMRRKRRGPKA